MLSPILRRYVRIFQKLIDRPLFLLVEYGLAHHCLARGVLYSDVMYCVPVISDSLFAIDFVSLRAVPPIGVFGAPQGSIVPPTPAL